MFLTSTTILMDAILKFKWKRYLKSLPFSIHSSTLPKKFSCYKKNICIFTLELLEVKHLFAGVDPRILTCGTSLYHSNCGFFSVFLVNLFTWYCGLLKCLPSHDNMVVFKDFFFFMQAYLLTHLLFWRLLIMLYSKWRAVACIVILLAASPLERKYVLR